MPANPGSRPGQARESRFIKVLLDPHLRGGDDKRDFLDTLQAIVPYRCWPMLPKTSRPQLRAEPGQPGST